MLFLGERIIIREEILKNVKKVCSINDEKYDAFIMFYFDLGEAQIKRYLGAKKLTSTLYLLINKYVIYKVDTAIKKGILDIFKEDGELVNNQSKQMCFIDDFFIDHGLLLNKYKKLVSLES